MDVNNVIDVFSILLRSNRFDTGERIGLFALELLSRLAAEYDDFPRLRAQLEQRFPADPFIRAVTANEPSIAPPPADPVVSEFVRRVLGMGRYQATHFGGIVNPRPGDFHLRMMGHPFPVSIAFEEMHLLARLLRERPATQPLRILEIGTGFGISSTFLAFVAASLPQGYEIVTVDPFVEDRNTDHASIDGTGFDPATANYANNLSYQSFRALAQEFAELRVEQVLDFSPRCFTHPAIAGRTFDFVFIDGNHFGEQPTIDFEGALPYTHANTLFALHDAHSPGVVLLLEKLRPEPWQVTNHGTSCNLTTVRRADA